MSKSNGVPIIERPSLGPIKMERRLLEAARKGNIDELNDLIGSNALIVEEMALEGAGHTPLHVACVAGHLDFVRELLKLMPKFAEKVNAGGLSPLHIAAARGDVEVARELLTVGRHLCSVKGRERRIPLHYAVVNGELHVMKLLLSASPESIEETTAREETALHLAVKNNRFEAVVVLVEHLKQSKKEQVINWKDHKGNTALHLAAMGKEVQVVDFMFRGLALEYEVVEVNASNESGSTPLDVSTLSQRGAGDREMRELLARAGAKHGRGRSNSPASRPVLAADEDDIEGANSQQSDGEPVTNAPRSLSHLQSKDLNKDRESLGDIRNALLVVAALIASATYQSVLQPPSIIKVDEADPDNGYREGTTNAEHVTKTYGANLVYTLFLGGNTLGFLVSVQMIICLTKDLPVKRPLMLSLIAMVLTYFCFTLSLLLTSMGSEAYKNVLRLTPLVISVFLLLIQRWLAVAIDLFLGLLFQFNLLGGMYSLKRSKDQNRGC
ncbi:ankyrin repeat-containing protein BDA1-like [Syzygium oleosum]|uniref:ankyrin repeat-containing protein BDA1-like n=1 Tax=Syzygium oleosum TaxID=219896 RepID=UPI0024BB0CE5|nr:ankyrin repeat-containing protein BDA1-like [Syzygium oleosum]